MSSVRQYPIYFVPVVLLILALAPATEGMVVFLLKLSGRTPYIHSHLKSILCFVKETRSGRDSGERPTIKSFHYNSPKTKTQRSLFLHSTRFQSWKKQHNYHHTRPVCLQGDLLLKSLLRRTESNGSRLSWPYCKEPEASEWRCSLG